MFICYSFQIQRDKFRLCQLSIESCVNAQAQFTSPLLDPPPFPHPKILLFIGSRATTDLPFHIAAPQQLVDHKQGPMGPVFSCQLLLSERRIVILFVYLIKTLLKVNGKTSMLSNIYTFSMTFISDKHKVTRFSTLVKMLSMITNLKFTVTSLLSAKPFMKLNSFTWNLHSRMIIS